MEGLDDLLEALHAGGQQDSTGRFTVAGQHALAKLRKFQFQEKHLYALPLYSSAVAAGARRVRASVGKKTFGLEHDGPALTRSQLEGLLDVLVNGGAPAAYELAGRQRRTGPRRQGARPERDLQAAWSIDGDQVRCEVGPHLGQRVPGVRVLVGPRVLKVDELEGLRQRAGYAPVLLELAEPPVRRWQEMLAGRELLSPEAPLPALGHPRSSRAESSEGFSIQLGLFAEPVPQGALWSRLGVELDAPASCTRGATRRREPSWRRAGARRTAPAPREPRGRPRTRAG